MIELYAYHQSHAAHLAHAWHSAKCLSHAIADQVPHRSSIRHQVFFLDDGEGGERCRTGEWIAAESRPVIARFEYARGRSCRQASADRHARGESFRKCHYVGL